MTRSSATGNVTVLDRGVGFCTRPKCGFGNSPPSIRKLQPVPTALLRGEQIHVSKFKHLALFRKQLMNSHNLKVPSCRETHPRQREGVIRSAGRAFARSQIIRSDRSGAEVNQAAQRKTSRAHFATLINSEEQSATSSSYPPSVFCGN